MQFLRKKNSTATLAHGKRPLTGVIPRLQFLDHFFPALKRKQGRDRQSLGYTPILPPRPPFPAYTNTSGTMGQGVVPVSARGCLRAVCVLAGYICHTATGSRVTTWRTRTTVGGSQKPHRNRDVIAYYPSVKQHLCWLRKKRHRFVYMFTLCISLYYF